jgi:hypothetical protein
MSFKKITFAIFIIITLSMAGLFFGLPLLAEQPRNMLIGICVIAGLVLSGILSAIVYGLGKNAVRAGFKPARTLKAAPPAETALFDEKAVQVLSILQKKGRLIDFLQEDITGYEDSQIGAAVRNIHKGCREALAEYMTIEPVMKETEGTDITVEEGFDSSAIRLTGNVAGSPPFKGVLRHCGWRVSGTTMPALPKNQDLSIIEPAEVEMS